MTIVIGQIEPLKKLRDTLQRHGISRFNSIGDINNFIKSYKTEREEIPATICTLIDDEIANMQSELIRYQQIIDELTHDAETNLSADTEKIEDELRIAAKIENQSFLKKIWAYLKHAFLNHKKSSLQTGTAKYLKKKSKPYTEEIESLTRKLNEYAIGKEDILSRRCAEAYRAIDRTKAVIDELSSTIAGAVGENLVVNELKKLPDNHYLINDFSADFNPPIYNKNKNDRIYSIQIDHLLICQAGVFLLETKNWSRQSVLNLDLMSPIEQVLRTNFALFLLLNGKSKHHDIGLSHHHWGGKKIPIRNVVVMTAEKPREEFKHVKIVSLSELIGYIGFFDSIFSEIEVKNIFDYLNNQNRLSI